MALSQSLKTLLRPMGHSIKLIAGQNSSILSQRFVTPMMACSNRNQLLQAVRSYRGEAGEGVANLSPHEQELLRVAEPRSKEIFARHTAMPDLTDVPKASFDPSATTADADLPLEIRRKRLIYRSKQRGWSEVDLLLGTWAARNVPTLAINELDEYEAFVNLETIDIYNVITLRLDVPEDMKTTSGDGVVERIAEWARSSPLGRADPEKYKSVKAENNLI